MGANPQVNRPLSDDDRALLEGLVRTDGPRLLAYVRRAFGPSGAEDVVAETFCRAAARIDGLWTCERKKSKTENRENTGQSRMALPGFQRR